MAISLNKPNMPGVKQSLGTSKGTSASTTAAKNLTTGSRPNAFSFRGVGKKGFVHGRNTIKEMNLSRLDCTNLRAELNSGRRVVQQTIAPDTSIYGANVNYKTSGAFNSGANWGTGIAVGIGILNGLAGLLGKNNSAPVSATQQLTTVLESQGAGVSTATTLSSATATSALNAMTQATTAGDLQLAINNAEAEYSTMESNDPKLKEDSDKAKANLGTLQENVGKEETNVKNLETTISQGEQELKGLNAELTKLDGGYKLACDDVDNKTTLHKNAEKSVSDAQKELNDANSLPADDPTKTAKVAAANEKLESAKAAERLAKKNLESAEATKKDTFEKLGNKKDEVKATEDKIKQQKEDIEKAKEGLEDAKKKFEKAKEDLNNANSAIKAYTDNAKDMVALRQAIDQQNKRLEQLKKSETQKLGSLNSQIQRDEAQNAELEAGINRDDGYSKQETRNMRRIEKNNAQNEQRRADVSQLIDSQLKLQTPQTGTDGNAYRVYQAPNGQTYYSRNNLMITEDEYNEAKRQYIDV